MPVTKRIKPHRAGFLEDMRIYWDRGLRHKEDIAEALGISVPTLNRRLCRCREDGHLPPAVRGAPFDPFGKLPRGEPLYGTHRTTSRMTTRARIPHDDYRY